MIAVVDIAYKIQLFTDGIKEDREGSLCGVSSWWTYVGTAYWTFVQPVAAFYNSTG